MKTLIKTLTLAAVFCAVGGLAQTAAAAEQCRNEKCQFIKCPEAPAAATKCRDIKTKKFAKCGTPGTEAIPAKS